jgi:hypothetical protein
MEKNHPDHEAEMAKSELANIAKNAVALYKMIEEGDELDGWISIYITISNDHINSVREKMEYEIQADNAMNKGEREYEAGTCESIRDKLTSEWELLKG